MTTSSANKVTVKIVRSNEARTAENIRPEHVVHYHELEWLVKELASRVDRNDKAASHSAPSVGSDRRYDTILVHGSRGSGKTTFIEDFRKLLEGATKSQHEFSEYFKKIGKTAHCFETIDPTMLHRTEDLIVLLVALIREEVVSTLRRRSVDHHDSELHAWRASLKNLAKSIDSVDLRRNGLSEEGFSTADAIVESGLQRMTDGHALESRFHEYVKRSLSVLGKSMFVLILDDIDTNVETGWPVLEMLRRYCGTPLVSTVVLGDLDLYTLRVRAAQLQSLGSDLRRHEKERRHHYATPQRETKSSFAVEDELLYDTMLDSLQSQYLTKVLPPVMRVRLQNLAQLTNSSDLRIDLTNDLSRAGEKREFSDYGLKNSIDAVLQYGSGILDEVTRKIAARMILSQPFRTVYSLFVLERQSAKNATKGLEGESADNEPSDFVLYFYVQSQDQSRVVLTDCDKRNETNRKKNEYSLTLRRLYRARLTAALQDSLTDSGINFYALDDGAPTFEELANYLNRYGLWEPFSKSGLDGLSDEIGLALIVLSTYANGALVRHRWGIWDYWLRIGASSASEQAEVGFGSWAGISRCSTSSGLMSGRHVAWRYGRKAVPQSGRRSGAVRLVTKIRTSATLKTWKFDAEALKKMCLANLDVRSPYGSMVVLSASGSEGSRFYDYVTLKNRLKRTGELLVELYELPSVVVADKFSPGMSFLSVFPVIEFIAYSEQVVAQLRGQTETKLGQNLFKVAKVFNVRKSQPVFVPSLERTQASNEEADDVKLDDISNDQDGEFRLEPYKEHEFFKVYGEWFDWGAALDSVDAELLSRIWSRFEAMLGSQVNGHDGFGVGYSLHLQIVALFYSILIEESILRQDYNIYASGVKTYDRYFDLALATILSEHTSDKVDIRSDSGMAELSRILEAEYPVFSRVASCPLWLAYLRPCLNFPEHETSISASIAFSVVTSLVVHFKAKYAKLESCSDADDEFREMLSNDGNYSVYCWLNVVIPKGAKLPEIDSNK